MVDLVNTWALPLGAAALALPVLIHWLTRPRPVPMPLSTVRFIVQALKQSNWWHRLKNWLLLILRAAAVLLIAAAMARPLLDGKPQVSLGDTAGAVRVVVLDVSESMAAIDNGIQLFERARAEAAKYLRHGSGFRANLILAGATPSSAFPQPSSNLEALRKQLSEARPAYEELALIRAIDAAAGMLATAEQGERRELVVVSDFQRSNWTAADFSSLPADTKIELVSVAPDYPLENVAVTRVRCDQRPTAKQSADIVVEVANHSQQSRLLKVQLTVGQRVENAQVECSAGGNAQVVIPVRAHIGEWQAVVAQLDDHHDALEIDDRRSFVLSVRRSPELGLLTREDPADRPSASYYIDRALTASDGQDASSEMVVSRLNPAQMNADALDDLDGLVLVRPGRLEGAQVARLVALMRGGRPLLYVASDPVDAHNLQAIATAAGSDLQAPATYAPYPRGIRREELFLADVRVREPPFAVFGDRLAANISTLRFTSGLLTERNPRVLPEDILATYSDKSICLSLTPCGRGSLAVWNVDLLQTNLPGSSAFVPIVTELARLQLADRAQSDAEVSGERIVQRLPPAVRSPVNLEVAGPEGAEGALGELRATDDAVLWDCPRAGNPGVYRIVDADQSGATVFATAVAPPRAESDLWVIDPALLSGRLAGGRDIHYQAGGHGESNEDSTWSWLAAGCVCCLLMEFLALGAFRV